MTICTRFDSHGRRPLLPRVDPTRRTIPCALVVSGSPNGVWSSSKVGLFLLWGRVLGRVLAVLGGGWLVVVIGVVAVLFIVVNVGVIVVEGGSV